MRYERSLTASGSRRCGALWRERGLSLRMRGKRARLRTPTLMTLTRIAWDRIPNPLRPPVRIPTPLFLIAIARTPLSGLHMIDCGRIGVTG
jgi:hypothetical protein